jgi:exodeoxyribonuclease-5
VDPTRCGNVLGMSYTLSQDQVSALRHIGAWYRGRTAPYLTLGGYAGTGKTTLISYLRQALTDYEAHATVGFCAYTGKATRVLERKLHERRAMRRGDSISTIHSLIYSTEDTQGGVPRWILKESLERSLIVVDEASMVDETIWADLLSFGIPILAVGDHGQLPPIGSSFNLMSNPTIRLERIFRQEVDSPIIEVATLARETGHLPVQEFGPGVRKLDRSSPETGVMVEELLSNWKSDLLILCGYNATRMKLNRAIREMRDMQGPEPQSGDQVVCLRNNRTKHIFNGMTGQIVRIVPAGGPEGSAWYEAEIALEGEDYHYNGFILREQFGTATTIKDVDIAPDGERGDLWDFGYALTVHKAQGSQAPNVIVFEEKFARSSDEDWRRWLYTAVTRSELELTVIGPGDYDTGNG